MNNVSLALWVDGVLGVPEQLLNRDSGNMSCIAPCQKLTVIGHFSCGLKLRLESV
jgi:hypothetical protein